MGRTLRKALLLGANGPLGGTWNPSDKSANITLSGGNLTATHTTGIQCSLRGTVSRTIGRWTYKTTIGAAAANYPGLGIANASATLSDYLGSDAHGIAYYSSGNIYFGGAVVASTGVTFTAGDVISVTIDLLNMTISWQKNGVLVYAPISIAGISGAVFAAAGMTTGSALTSNFTT